MYRTTYIFRDFSIILYPHFVYVYLCGFCEQRAPRESVDFLTVIKADIRYRHSEGYLFDLQRDQIETPVCKILIANNIVSDINVNYRQQHYTAIFIVNYIMVLMYSIYNFYDYVNI